MQLSINDILESIQLIAAMGEGGTECGMSPLLIYVYRRYLLILNSLISLIYYVKEIKVFPYSWPGEEMLKCFAK